MARPKVFCIGFHKTGTTTMRAALEMLGYRVTGPNGTRDPEIAAKLEAMVDRLATEFDAFQDNPWPLVYRRMDAEWPGSRPLYQPPKIHILSWKASIIGRSLCFQGASFCTSFQSFPFAELQTSRGGASND